MKRLVRPLLCVAAVACFVAGLLPGGWGSSHPLADGSTVGSSLGLPCSPLFRSRGRTSDARPEPREDGTQPSWFTSTVYTWEFHPLSWSGALVGAGAVLLVLGLRRGAAAN